MKNTRIETRRNNQQIRRNTKEQQIWTTNQKSQIRNTYTNPDFPNPGATEAAAAKLRRVLHRVLLWVPWASCSTVGSLGIVVFRGFLFFLCSSSSDRWFFFRLSFLSSSLDRWFFFRSILLQVVISLFVVSLFVVRSLFFFRCVLRSLVLLLRRSSWFGLLELESFRLEIYVAFSV